MGHVPPFVCVCIRVCMYEGHGGVCLYEGMVVENVGCRAEERVGVGFGRRVESKWCRVGGGGFRI